MGASGESAEIVWLTHVTRERQMQRSLDRIAALPEVNKINSRIRVEG
jgi:hypothetical protein